jgi:hypothetical protein
MARFDSAGSVLNQLGLSEESVRSQANFYLAYAEELESARSPASRTGVWSELANPDQSWTGQATLASTYRLAAQFLALIDPLHAALVAVRAAMVYLELGMPFGALLATALLDDTMLRTRSGRRRITRPLRVMLTEHTVQDPVQRLYLLLAAIAHPELRDAASLRSIRALRTELSAHQLHPVGAQGAPLASYFEIVTLMLPRDVYPAVVLNLPEQYQPRSRLFEALIAIGRQEAATLLVAQRNDYLWSHAAAPVDVVDLEGTAICGLAMRSERMPASPYEALSERMSPEDPLSEIPMWAAQALQRELLNVPDEVDHILTGGQLPEGGRFDS